MSVLVLRAGCLFPKDNRNYSGIFIWSVLKNGSTVYFSSGRFNDSRTLTVWRYLSLLEVPTTAWGTTTTEDSWHPEELYLESRRDIPLISHVKRARIPQSSWPWPSMTSRRWPHACEPYCGHLSPSLYVLRYIYCVQDQWHDVTAVRHVIYSPSSAVVA